MRKAVSTASSVMVALLFGLLIIWAVYLGYSVFGQALITPAYAASATFTVNSTADPGTGGCNATECTLREAITAANATPEADTIKFNIPGSGLHTIAPSSSGVDTSGGGCSSGSSGSEPLCPPAPLRITAPVTIDGYSQPGASPNTNAVGNNAVLKIQLSGVNAGGAGTGLMIEAANSTVKGLAINRWNQSIIIRPGSGSSSGASGGSSGSSGSSAGTTSGGTSTTATGNKIQGNFIGTDASGDNEAGNEHNGVLIDQASNNTVGGTTPAARNIISGSNSASGVRIQGSSATGNFVQGNYIGTDRTGTVDLGNTLDGVNIFDAPFNTIGGTKPTMRNIISGNERHGVFVTGSGGVSDAGGNKVMGNYIGTNATGTADLGNFWNGVNINGSVRNTNNTIGGRVTRKSKPGNVISGNDAHGVIIDGSNATGNRITGNYVGTKANGTESLGNSWNGVLITGASDNTVGGATAGERNIVSANSIQGVEIQAGNGRNQLMGNYIGTDRTGTVDLGNAGTGVYLNGSPDNTVGGTTAGVRNLISANNASGVVIYTSAATGNKVQGNYIGTDASGTKDLGNYDNGVGISGAPDNTIGGTEAGARNVISGNGPNLNTFFGGNGVYLDSGATGNKVQGNYIGTDASGTKDLGNHVYGVYIQGGSANTIGGTEAGARNVISGNGDPGVIIFTGAGGNFVQGNYIGTDKSGTLKLGNGWDGVRINDSPNNAVGGTDADDGAVDGVVKARNIISNNDGTGVTIGFGASATGNKVEGNYIGTDVTGTKPLGNLTGVHISEAPNNTIGGTEAGARNTISYNKSLGVGISNDTGGATGNSILRNSIFSNNDPASSFPELGIDLMPNFGVTANSATDPWQNFPEDLSATRFGEQTTIQGKVTGNSPGTTLTIQFFSSPAADPSGNGEGKTFLGETQATSACEGGGGDDCGTNAVASFSFFTSTKIPAGAFVTATATDSAGNTSEFSEALRVP